MFLRSSFALSRAEIDCLVAGRYRVSYRTFARRIGTAEMSRIFPIFAWGRGSRGERLKDDPRVAFYRGVYRGRRCYFVEQSFNVRPRLHYIFSEARDGR